MERRWYFRRQEKNDNTYPTSRTITPFSRICRTGAEKSLFEESMLILDILTTTLEKKKKKSQKAGTL
jgi:hypothetical protein